MSLSSLLTAKKKELKHCNTVVTNMLGEKYEILGSEMRLIDKGLPFVVDTKPDLQMAMVEPGLYFGSQDPAVNIDILQTHGIRHIISIGIKLEIVFEDIQYNFIDLMDIPEAKISEALKACLGIMRESQGQGIFIHCNAGVSRSASVVIGYLMIKKNLSYDQAYQEVKSIRECIKPNDGFVKQLKALEFSDFSSFF
ncbi:dual specificity protein phosphatase 19 [Diprion similis]|uniref:dual specificity protein phosphatase 19 n=1 Tax=Diprion similis TaxID=362088 RepID=UPI001EF79704|nr:dual specificity protein phosphatase 19 [Diprion similis]